MTLPNPQMVPTGQGWVDRDAVAAFALATNDDRPAYFDGSASPPAFTVSLIFADYLVAAAEIAELINDWTGVLHGEHDIWLHRPVLPGMDLYWKSSFHSIRRNRAGIVDTQRIVISDACGTPLVEHYWSNLSLSGTVDAERGDDKPAHEFPPEARNHPLGSLEVPVSWDQTFRYGGAAGDRAPHALNDAIAQAEGFPSKILQGMCTFALSSTAMIDLAAGGDPTLLRRIAGRFASPAFPGKDLVVSAYEAGQTDDGYRAVAFEVSQEDIAVIKHGWTEVRPQDPPDRPVSVVG